METRDLALQIYSRYPPEPIEYDPSSQEFTVDTATLTLSDFSQYIPPPKPALSVEATQELLDTPGLYTQFGNQLLLFPPTYDWLRSMDKESHRSTAAVVVETMIDAYAALTGTEKRILARGRTHMDFRMGLLRPGHPVFQVVGNCACMGVTPHGMTFGEEAWEAGFAEFELHNVDSKAQETALFAGAGVLSRLCRIDTGQRLT